MPVLSKCPLCRGVMPEVRGEVRCPRCGELVLPSVRKLCAACGDDVTRVKRIRDDSGEYYCHDCWARKLAASGEEPGYVCQTCRQVFPSDDVYQDGDDIICKQCLQERNLDPNDLLEAASHVGDEAPAVFNSPNLPSHQPLNVWPWIIAAGVTLAVLIGVLLYLAR